MTELARITVNLVEIRAGRKAGQNPMFAAIAHAISSSEAKAALEHCEECTIVYHACGSCPNGGAMVEYFCSSNGGSEPDYYMCDNC
jgi:predicted metal-dependent RNase